MEKLAGLVLDGEEWFTVAATAAQAGITVEAVYKSIERGRLVPRDIMGVTAIAASDIRRLWPEAQQEPVAEVVG